MYRKAVFINPLAIVVVVAHDSRRGVNVDQHQQQLQRKPGQTERR